MVLSNKELIEYLKQATQLEALVYKQEEARKRAKNELSMASPELAIITKKSIREPQKPKEVSADISKPKQLFPLLLIGGIVLIIAGMVMVFQGAGMSTFGAVLAVIGICLCCAAYNINKSLQADKTAVTKYKHDLEVYQRQYEEYIQKSQEAERVFQEEQNKAKTEYLSAKRNYEIASSAVAQLDPPLEESKSVLKKLYSFDIIFPKYRNLVAVSTFYEYFVSGRVTELEGPTGAYNLFEQELRMNLIINKLDIIITKLDEIKSNQYALYNELKDTKSIIRGIAEDVEELVATAHSIEDATRITAFYSQVTAQNTEALKYIALVNG